MKRRHEITFCVLTAFLILSVLVNVWQCGSRNAGVAGAFSDTVRITRIDTVAYYKPVPRDSVVVRRITAKLPVAKDTAQDHVPDTGKMADSVQVELPIEQKRYSDDSTYTAYVSGYRPRLDSIFVYPRREVVAITTERTAYKYKRRRFGIGIQAGYGITPRGMQPYVGVGASYDLLQF